MSSIRKIYSAMEGGGIPKNRFNAIFSLPAGVSGGEQLNVLCNKFTSVDLDIGTVEVDYMGRKAKYAGDREISDLSVSFYATPAMYKLFLDWSNIMNDISENIGSTNVQEYIGSVTLETLNRAGDLLVSTEHNYIFPLKVSGFDLDMSSKNSTQILSVTFACSDVDIKTNG